jgi:hypothetical protein
MRYKGYKFGLRDPWHKRQKNDFVRSLLTPYLDVTLTLPLLFSASVSRYPAAGRAVLCIVSFGLEGIPALLAFNNGKWFGFAVETGFACLATESPGILAKVIARRLSNQSPA